MDDKKCGKCGGTKKIKDCAHPTVKRDYGHVCTACCAACKFSWVRCEFGNSSKWHALNRVMDEYMQSDNRTGTGDKMFALICQLLYDMDIGLPIQQGYYARKKERQG